MFVLLTMTLPRSSPLIFVVDWSPLSVADICIVSALVDLSTQLPRASVVKNDVSGSIVSFYLSHTKTSSNFESLPLYFLIVTACGLSFLISFPLSINLRRGGIVMSLW